MSKEQRSDFLKSSWRLASQQCCFRSKGRVKVKHKNALSDSVAVAFGRIRHSPDDAMSHNSDGPLLNNTPKPTTKRVNDKNSKLLVNNDDDDDDTVSVVTLLREVLISSCPQRVTIACYAEHCISCGWHVCPSVCYALVSVLCRNDES